MRLPRWDELDQKQRDVLDTPVGSPLFAVGPPGSGKTVLAVRRAAQISKAGRPVVIVTFNRMLRRLLRLLDGESVVIRTMHSFTAHDFTSRGGECDLGEDREFDWRTMIKHLDHDKTVVDPVDLVVDEGQDLPEGFYRYVSRGVRTLTVFADQAQAVRTNSTSIEQIMRATGLDAPTMLQDNHRNVKQVARLAHHFHSGSVPVATVRRPTDGERPRLVRTPSIKETAERIATRFRNRSGNVGVIVRTNDTGKQVHDELRVRLPKARVDRYDGKSRNEDSILLTEPGVTVLTKESAKGQEFDAVFLLELERFLPFATDADRRAMYMMCSRARDMLTLVYGPSPLTSAAAALLPDAEVLERS